MMQRLNIVLLFVLLFVMTLNLLDTCSRNNNTVNDVKAVNSFNEKEDDQVVKDTNLKVEDIELMKQNLMSEKAANELLKKEIESYKRIKSYVKAELVSAINNLRIDFSGAGEENIPSTSLATDSTINLDTVNKYFVRVPKVFRHSDKQWFSLSGSVDKKGILFDTIQFINKFDVTIGYKKGKRFYNKSEPVVELKSYNPYTSVPYVNNIVVQQNKAPWYYSRVAMLFYGFGAGYGISTIKNN